MLMLASVSILTICCGVLCLQDADLAWRLYEWDCQLMNITPPRIANWRTRVQQVGYGLIGLGLLGFIIGIGL